jgi:sporulation-control protein
LVFKKVLKAFGVGGPSVDTVLDGAPCRPGGQLTGVVKVGGASSETDIESIVLTLVVVMESEQADDRRYAVELLRETVTGAFRLADGEHRELPFSLALPWELPITEVLGNPLPGMGLGVRTEVAVAKAVDKGDSDPVRVEPLESQQRVLDAMFALGCHLRSADVEHGRIHGVAQELPCYQEIEFFPPPHAAGRIGEIELTFVTRADGVDVVLEADKRGGLFSSGHDAFGRFHRSHEDALTTDWAAEIGGWLEAVLERAPASGHHDHYGHHDHHGGPGMGGMLAAGAAGVAAGVVGGMVMGEVIDEVGDFFEGDEEF